MHMIATDKSPLSSLDIGERLPGVVPYQIPDEGRLADLGRPYDGHDDGRGLEGRAVDGGQVVALLGDVLLAAHAALRLGHVLDREGLVEGEKETKRVG